MKIVAVTACPTGIAHTYMAADALSKAAPKKACRSRSKLRVQWGLKTLSPLKISCAQIWF